jgi:hypothetical protein
MITGYKITEEQANEFIGREFSPNSYYNPVKDINGDWFIFEVEYTHSGLQLEPSEYVLPPSND